LFYLDAYRREMGVLDAAPVPLGSDLEPLETEDNDVIVFTRLENQDLSPGLEPDPSEDTMSHPDASRFLSEAAREAADKEFDARARAIAASAVADEVTAKLKPSSVSAPERPSRTRREPDFLTRHTGALLAIILALLCAILILVFAIAFRFWQS
jgi:crotonobetainyl-CoA:carnitine CoA-transferase CaiB-like acyl-CoA transferase